jgi:hypothetical protein
MESLAFNEQPMLSFRNPQRQRLLERRGAIRSGELYPGSEDISFELAHQREQDVLPGALEEAADAGEDLKRWRQVENGVEAEFALDCFEDLRVFLLALQGALIFDRKFRAPDNLNPA